MSAAYLPRFRAPTNAGEEIGFRDWISACGHLCDHVLTPPEMWAWTWLLPEMRPYAQAYRARYRLGREIWRTGGRAASGLLEALMRTIGGAVADAVRLGWSFREGGDDVYFGPSGILAVVGEGGILRSAYIPLPVAAALDPAVARDTGGDDAIVAHRSRNPFPRERKAPETGIPWSDVSLEEVLRARFRIFRRASSEVRSRLLRSSSREGRKDPPPVAKFREARRDMEVWRSLIRPPPEDIS